MRKTSARGEVPTDTHFASAAMSHLLAQCTPALKGPLSSLPVLPVAHLPSELRKGTRPQRGEE